MRFTLSWMNNHLNTIFSSKQICDTLNKISLEFESGLSA